MRGFPTFAALAASSTILSPPRLQPVSMTTALVSVDGNVTAIGGDHAWLSQWYPACFAAGVEAETLVPVTIFERDFVLWRDDTGNISCLKDECPHRLAPLSEGRIATDEDGKQRIECSYHGWQFSGCGRCTLLPQLDEGKPILSLYDCQSQPCQVSQGIVYIFMGDKARASAVPVPTVPELDDPTWLYEQDYMRDLPYDYTTLCENIIDPSHVPVSHHGTSQGNRALAQPLPISLSRDPPLGFTGETEVPLHGSSRLSLSQQKVTQTVQFTAPSLLSYKFSVGAGDACALFYPIPVARGRSRVLVRRARNFATDRKMGPAELVAKHLENNVRMARSCLLP